MLDLKDVTLCAIDSVHVDLTARALRHSMERCRFGEALLISDQPASGPFLWRKIDSIGSHEAYSNFLLKQLGAFIQTPFVLLVQWDGYILDPTAWSDEFLEYDYIGARWPWIPGDASVGNGGFSLRSRKLLRALADPRFIIPPGLNEDAVICHEYRSVLAREYGIRFAPVRIADRFSYELAAPDAPTFGFHGMLNLWRHVDDSEMCEFARQIKLGGRLDGAYAGLLLHYYQQRKFAPMRVMYERLHSVHTPEALSRLLLESAHLLAFKDEAETVASCLRSGEEMLRRSRSSASTARDDGRSLSENNP